LEKSRTKIKVTRDFQYLFRIGRFWVQCLQPWRMQ
jgi:hypothetical protein